MLRSLARMTSRTKSPPVKLEQLRSENGFKAKRQDHDPDTLDESAVEYIIEGPLRKVEPYFYTYLTYCKLRWRDRTLIDIFSTEFRDREEDYYRKAIASGQVLINGKPAEVDQLVRNGDLISHKIHRHEPPVTSRPIKIVKEVDDLVIIDKPAGIPVHPTGRYRFNTVTKILKIENGLEVHPCNRLDRLTSGLMFLSKTPQVAEHFTDQLKAREVRKQYVARVIGNFPNEVTIENPLTTAEPRLGLNVVDKEGKPAKTVFKKISFDGKTSIIKAQPLTGRTHQIRVHLQYLGYPIANDPIYSNEYVWGKNLGKDGVFDIEQVKTRLNEIGKTKSASSWFYPDSSGELLLGEKCEVCDTELYSDPGVNDLDLWLHAYKYHSSGSENVKPWSYQTDFPEWALEPHKKFMELAIEQAQRCGETTTAFSVGAVLVKDGEILETGYSRELPGNTHAEQSALEKYYARTGESNVPEGTVIYTTMEPCSERLSGNTPCVDRILKTSIKTVFVGIIEPSTFVQKNTGLEKLEAKEINYIKIPGYEEQCIKAAFKGHPGH